MSKAAHIYAKAIYAIADETSLVVDICDDMRLVSQTLTQHKELKAIITSPVIPANKKESILKEVFKDVNSLTSNLISTLLENKRISLLGMVADAFVKLYELNNNIQRAKVVVANEMTTELAQQIQQKVNHLTGNHVDITTEIDPSILGGFILTINDLQYDASVSGKLNKFKTQLVN